MTVLTDNNADTTQKRQSMKQKAAAIIKTGSIGVFFFFSGCLGPGTGEAFAGELMQLIIAILFFFFFYYYYLSLTHPFSGNHRLEICGVGR